MRLEASGRTMRSMISPPPSPVESTPPRERENCVTGPQIHSTTHCRRRMWRTIPWCPNRAASCSADRLGRKPCRPGALPTAVTARASAQHECGSASSPSPAR